MNNNNNNVVVTSNTDGQIKNNEINFTKYLQIIESAKTIESIDKSKFVYRLAINFNLKSVLKYQKAFEYFKLLKDKINAKNYDYLCKDSHYFYFNFTKDLSDSDKNKLQKYLNTININKSDKNKVYNITINLKNILSYKNMLDNLFK